MIPEESVLVTLVWLVDRIPEPARPGKRGRGKPRTYAEKLSLTSVVVGIVRRLPRVHELLCVLEQPTSEMRALRSLLTEDGKVLTRRRRERRLGRLPESLPGRIACLGAHLVALIGPWAAGDGRAAVDSTILRASGGVWHKKHREAGELPHTSIDTEARWTKSGWHGWVYGWKPHLARRVPADYKEYAAAALRATP